MVDWVDIVNGEMTARVARRSFERVWKREGWKLADEQPTDDRQHVPVQQGAQEPTSGQQTSGQQTSGQQTPEPSAQESVSEERARPSKRKTDNSAT